MEEPAIKETTNVLSDLICVFEEKDDMEIVDNISSIKNNIHNITRERDHSLQRAIQNLTSEINMFQSQLNKPLKDQYTKQKKQLLTKKEKILSQIEQYKKIITIEQNKLSKLSNVEHTMKKEKEAAEQSMSKVVPKLVNLLTLYTNVSQIIWNLESNDQELTGTIHLINKKQVAPFTINKNANDVEIADYLWDQMYQDFV